MGKLVVTIGVGDQHGRQCEDLEVTVDSLLWRRHLYGGVTGPVRVSLSLVLYSRTLD